MGFKYCLADVCSAIYLCIRNGKSHFTLGQIALYNKASGQFNRTLKQQAGTQRRGIGHTLVEVVAHRLIIYLTLIITKFTDDIILDKRRQSATCEENIVTTILQYRQIRKMVADHLRNGWSGIHTLSVLCFYFYRCPQGRNITHHLIRRLHNSALNT